MRSKLLILISLLLFCSSSFAQHKKKFFFKAEKSSIQKGETVRLKWQYKNHKDIHIPGVADDLPESGSIAVTPDSTTIYVLTASKTKNDIVTKKIIVKVIAPTFSYIRLSDSINDLTPCTFTWKTLDAEKVMIEGMGEEYPAIGNADILLDSSRVLKFIAINSFNKRTVKEVPVKVHIIEKCYALPKKIIIYESTKLFWDFKYTTSVNVEGYVQDFHARDSLIVSPDSSVIYTITANRTNGTKTSDTVSVFVQPAGVAGFTGNRTIIKGSICTLRWVTYAAHRVVLEGGGLSKEVPLSGSLSVKPTESTLYTLTAYCDGKISSRQFQVNVIERNFVDSVISINNLKSGQRMDFEIFEVDRSNYPNELKLKVLVVDTAGNFISGLAPRASDGNTSRKYFKKIIEVVDHKNVPINSFKVREVNESYYEPKDISMVLDYSGSMSSSIGHLMRSVKKFILNKDTASRISMVIFDDSIATVVKLDKNKERLLKVYSNIAYTQFGNSTSLYAAVDKGIKTLLQSNRNKSMLLFTDGYENSSFLHNDSLAYTAQDVVAKARNNDIRIHVIAFGDNLNTKLLEYMSVLTDGNIYKISNNNDILKVYKEFSIISKHYYEITYQPLPSEGERQVSLTCYNQFEVVQVKRSLYIGDNFNISEMSSGDVHFAYIDSIIRVVVYADSANLPGSKKMKALIVPQAVAFFDFDEYIVRAADEAKIDQYATWLAEHSNAKLLVLGHTDLKGSERSCDLLSMQRAEAVKECFVKKGINGNRIFAVACGKRFPVNSVETDEVKAQENRRVEVVLMQ